MNHYATYIAKFWPSIKQMLLLILYILLTLFFHFMSINVLSDSCRNVSRTGIFAKQIRQNLKSKHFCEHLILFKMCQYVWEKYPFWLNCSDKICILETETFETFEDKYCNHETHDSYNQEIFVPEWHSIWFAKLLIQ